MRNSRAIRWLMMGVGLATILVSLFVAYRWRAGIIAYGYIDRLDAKYWRIDGIDAARASVRAKFGGTVSGAIFQKAERLDEIGSVDNLLTVLYSLDPQRTISLCERIIADAESPQKWFVGSLSCGKSRTVNQLSPSAKLAAIARLPELKSEYPYLQAWLEGK